MTISIALEVGVIVCFAVCAVLLALRLAPQRKTRGEGAVIRSSPTVRLSDAELTDQVKALLFANLKINAIKLYREQTGIGLKDAKDAVEAMERDLVQRIAIP